MSIKTVSLIGLGAEGSVAYYALRHNLDREHVRVIAEGERAQRLKREGVVINGTAYDLNVTAAGSCGTAPDLIVAAVKSYQLPGIIEDIRREADRHTVLMSLINGLSSEEVLSKHFGPDQVIYSMSKINSKKAGNRVDFKPVGHIAVGEKDGTLTGRIIEIRDAFSGAVSCEASSEILLDIWRKYMLNAACNTVEAIFHGQHRWFQKIPEACDAMELVMQEIVALAQAMGVGLTQQDIRDLDGFFDVYAPDGMCSMVQDLLNKRPTEIEMFMGEALEMGKRCGLKLPVCRFVYDVIKSMDMVNAGILES